MNWLRRLLCCFGYHAADPPAGTWMLNFAHPGPVIEQAVWCARPWCWWGILIREVVVR